MPRVEQLVACKDRLQGPITIRVRTLSSLKTKNISILKGIAVFDGLLSAAPEVSDHSLSQQFRVVFDQLSIQAGLELCIVILQGKEGVGEGDEWCEVVERRLSAIGVDSAHLVFELYNRHIVFEWCVF